MTEQGYQKNIIKALEARGGYVVKISVASKKGVPDILCCYKGRFIAVEVKTPDKLNNTTKLQDYNLKTIGLAGGIAIVASDMVVLDTYLDNIDRGIT